MKIFSLLTGKKYTLYMCSHQKITTVVGSCKDIKSTCMTNICSTQLFAITHRFIIYYMVILICSFYITFILKNSLSQSISLRQIPFDVENIIVIGSLDEMNYYCFPHFDWTIWKNVNNSYCIALIQITIAISV